MCELEALFLHVPLNMIAMISLLVNNLYSKEIALSHSPYGLMANIQ